MKTNLYCLVLLFICLNLSVDAQEKEEPISPMDEISISTNGLNFDNLSLKYARNYSNNWWWKVGLINLNIDSYKHMPYVGSFNYTDTKINGGLLFGIDKEKLLTQKLSLMMGLNAQIIYQSSNYNTENPSIPESQRKNKVYKYSPGIGFGLGFFYRFNNNLLLGAELNPTASYYYEKSKIYNTNALFRNKGFNLSLNNNNAFLSLKYRF